MSPSCRTLSPFGIGGVSCLHSRGSRRPRERCRRRRSRSARSSRSQRAVIAAWVGCYLAVKRPANFSTRGAFHPRIAVRVPAILFLGASVSQVAAIRQARASGFRVVAVDADPDAVGFADADAAETVDFTDIDGVLEVACRYKIDAVVAISTDRAVPIAAAVSERLALPGIGTETALVMTDKAAMRARLKQAAIPQPSFVVVDEHADPAWQLEAIGFPAVLKPIDSGGQRGVYRIDDHASLAEHLPLSLSCSRSGRAILEQYVEGRELNGIIVAREGEPSLLTLSDRLRPPGAGFGVGWIHLYPSELEPAQLQAAGDVAVAAVRALGLRDGIAFPQLLVTDAGEVSVVEVAARIPAGQMADLVRLGTGIDLVDIALNHALG